MNSRTSLCCGMEPYMLNRSDIEYMCDVINCNQSNEMKANRLYLYCNFYTITENLKKNNELDKETKEKLERIKRKYYEYERDGLFPYSYNNYKKTTWEMEILFLKLNTASNAILEIDDDKLLADKLFSLFTSAKEFKETYLPFLNNYNDKKLDPITYSLDNFYTIYGTFLRLESLFITKSSDIKKIRPEKGNGQKKPEISNLQKIAEEKKALQEKKVLAKIQKINEYLSIHKERAVDLILEGINTGFIQEQIPFDINTLIVLLPDKYSNDTNLINPLLALIKSRKSLKDSNDVWYYVVNSEINNEKAIFAFRQENFAFTFENAIKNVDLDQLLEIISKNKKRTRRTR